MKIKNLNTNNLSLVINKKSNWTFNGKLSFSDHAYNFSSVTINNLINKEALKNNSLFSLSTFNNDIKGFSSAFLLSNDEIIFSGIINSVGRRSLAPDKIKDCSIIIEDIRSWLSKKSPPDIQFRDVSPIIAVNNLIKVLNGEGEEKFKIGNISFSNDNNIKAYDTTNKSPYSLLKEIIARQTNSFLYFTTDEEGRVIINFKSQNDLLSEEAITISPEKWEEYKISDINIDTDISSYINTIRIESDNVISDIPTTEYFELNNNTESVFLSGKIGKINFSINETKVFSSTSREESETFLLLTKKEAKAGNSYHAYYEKFRDELVLNPTWDKENKSILITYYKSGKQSVTIENHEQKELIKRISGFEGDVYQYTKNNDYSDLGDLIRHGRNEIDNNSTIFHNVTITSHKAFLNVGDIVNLQHGITEVDGRYICIEARGEIQPASNFISITYTLRNTINADTILNFYDNQAFRDKPLFSDGSGILDIDKFRKKAIFLDWKSLYKILIIDKNITKSHYRLSGYLNAFIDYSVENVVDFNLLFNNNDWLDWNIKKIENKNSLFISYFIE